MEDNTAKLLNTLANKLGTTTEYLWGILLKQAPIDATITLVQISIVILYGYFLLKTHRKLLKDEYYDEWELATTMPMILASVVFFCFAIMSFILIPSIIYGFFNPEYWALKEIFNSLHNH